MIVTHQVAHQHIEDVIVDPQRTILLNAIAGENGLQTAGVVA